MISLNIIFNKEKKVDCHKLSEKKLPDKMSASFRKLSDIFRWSSDNVRCPTVILSLGYCTTKSIYDAIKSIKVPWDPYILLSNLYLVPTDSYMLPSNMYMVLSSPYMIPSNSYIMVLGAIKSIYDTIKSVYGAI